MPWGDTAVGNLAELITAPLGQRRDEVRYEIPFDDTMRSLGNVDNRSLDTSLRLMRFVIEVN